MADVCTCGFDPPELTRGLCEYCGREPANTPPTPPPAERAHGLLVGLTPTLLRRLEALGYRPGEGNVVVWMVGELERMRADLMRAQKRADEAEARCDGLDERLHTADMPWRLPGCQCPSDSKPTDRCDSRWTRCSARLTYQRAASAAAKGGDRG